MSDSCTLFESDYDTYDAMSIATCCGENIENYATEHDFSVRVESQSIVDERRRLFKAVMAVAKKRLTDRQLFVLKLFIDGFTQEEIAKELGIHQTTVHKTLFGNLVYNGPYRGRRHGGVIAKLRKFCLKDPTILCILKEISSIRCVGLASTLPKQRYLVPGEFKYKYPIRGEYLKLSNGRLIFVGIASKEAKRAYIYKNKPRDDRASLLAQDGYDVIELHYNGRIIGHNSSMEEEG